MKLALLQKVQSEWGELYGVFSYLTGMTYGVSGKVHAQYSRAYINLGAAAI